MRLRPLNGAVASLIVALSLMAPASGSAKTPAPHWAVFSEHAPTSFHPGDTRDFYEIIAVNDGGVPTSEPITVIATMPAGVVVDAKNAYAEISGIFNTTLQQFTEGCSEATSEGVVTVTCKTASVVPVGRSIVMNINVEIPSTLTPGEALLDNEVVSGGGAQAATAGGSTFVTGAATRIPFGASFGADISEAGGTVARTAGSHPFSFTTLLTFNSAGVNPHETCNRNTTPSCASLDAQAKDVEVALPPGLVGNPTAVPHCTVAQFEEPGSPCPPSSQVGSIYLYFYGQATLTQNDPVYNIQPSAGQPGELGFTVGFAHIPIFFHVRNEDDYGVTVDASEISQFDPVRMALLSIWGEPSDEAHDRLRHSTVENCVFGCPSGVASPRPFLSMPTSCTDDSLPISVFGDSWQEEPVLTAPFPLLTKASIAGMAECDALTFEPSIGMSADTQQAGSPSGYTVNLHVPQHEMPVELATPDVRDAEVTLPEGTTLSPSAANGLAACSEAQFGLKARSRGHCPDASRLGSVKITTPLLAETVKGNLYLGEPECVPCSAGDTESGRMARVLLEAEAEGVIVKQAGHARVDQSTGRVTTVFRDTPQLPFSDLEVALESGSGAAFTNPTTCGPAVTDALITPWSSSAPASIRSNSIQIEKCGNVFSPTFQAGTTPSHAGAFAGLSMTLTHNDGDQTLGRVSVTTPPGLLGALKNVEQCQEPQASQGTCGAGSLIGSGSLLVGPGSTPLPINGSKVYLTGPYAGQPFGLSIVTPTVAGPFVLSGNTGNATEVVRASIAIDRHTGVLAVTSDPLPQALNGVPLDIRTIHVDINRENFTFNPTNCSGLSIAGKITGSGGALANVSTPFQATGCAGLPFKPKFTVSTQGKTSKKNGASLHVKVTSGTGQANIAKVKVNLPVQLPSRLTTLQKACVDHVFDANPSTCSSTSVVGSATAVTPLLAKPLTGPAYLVSHAGAAFPDLEVVLQGEGITLILDGNTQIKKGITSSIFRAVPDAPINTFDLNLPEGPHSALAAFGNLCTSKLNMPTIITGQNGKLVEQTTRITATGCPKHKQGRAARKKA